jgi:hypothetical protein
VIFGIYDALPDAKSCQVEADGSFSCVSGAGYGSGYGYGSSCPAKRTVSVEFTLPVSGDLTVKVAVPGVPYVWERLFGVQDGVAGDPDVRGGAAPDAQQVFDGV